MHGDGRPLFYLMWSRNLYSLFLGKIILGMTWVLNHFSYLLQPPVSKIIGYHHSVNSRSFLITIQLWLFTVTFRATKCKSNTSASSMKVCPVRLHDSLIISTTSGNLLVVSSPFLEKMRTEPSANLWIWARWPSYLKNI